MKIDASQIYQSQPSSSRLVVNSISKPMRGQQEAVNSVTRTTISPEAYRAAATGDVQSVDVNRPLAGLSLKDLLGKYDFKNVTPEQFAQLAGELLARKEISKEVAGNFMGTDLDKVESIPRNKPINMLEHMEMMAEVAKTPSPIAIKSRDEELSTLKNMISFAKGERLSLS